MDGFHRVPAFMRALVLTLLTTAAAVLLACGGPETVCSPANCGGCCDATGVCQQGLYPQSCGSNGAACTSCDSGLVCQYGFCTAGGGGGCKPKGCADLGLNCGDALDGCGGSVSCGTCETPGESCGANGTANVCAPGTCTPKTCDELGANCGKVSDGCGALLDCGTCTAPQTCGGMGTANVCQLPACTAKSCSKLGKNCGVVSDGCSGQLDCGTCSAAQGTCGGGGTPNVCGQGACTSKTCAELGKNCGAVDDGCGNALDCGTCQAPATCGGAGTPNVCGATCGLGCPPGFSCSNDGVCASSSATSLELNVKQTPKVNVSGKVLLNGATPTLSCATSSPASVYFESTTDSNYDEFVQLPCSAAFTFSTTLYPGTYKVSVKGTSLSNLPEFKVLVHSAVSINGNTSGLILNVVQAPKVNVSGSIKFNGATPTLSCATSSPASVYFESTTDSKYDDFVQLPCNAAFTFSTALYPGTYKVSVAGTSLSNLPEFKVLVQNALSVTGNTSGLVLNVVHPSKVNVSGRILLNGATPTLSCSSASPASVYFESTTDSKYDDFVQLPCDAAFTFSTSLYPGTYKVSVKGTSLSNLPEFPFVVHSVVAINGNTSGLLLNVVQPPKVNVSGSIKFNGAAPTLSCSSASPANVYFESTTDSKYDDFVQLPCNAAFTFSTTLYPGTYKVSVSGTSYSNLPEFKVVVQSALSITGNTSGLVLNVVQTPKVNVSGSIQFNGATPTLSCSTSSPAIVHFESTTDSKFDESFQLPCDSAFTFSEQLYPGTYKVSVSGTSYSNLPEFPVLVQSALTITGNTSGLLLNVVHPPKVNVSGNILLNGITPTLSCSSSSPATVRFESTIDPKYDESVFLPCDASFTFSAMIYPGTYRIVVTGNSFSNLPPWSVEIVERISLPFGSP